MNNLPGVRTVQETSKPIKAAILLGGIAFVWGAAFFLVDIAAGEVDPLPPIVAAAGAVLYLAGRALAWWRHG